MGGDAIADRVVIEQISRNRNRGCRERNKTRRAESVVIIHIPLVAKKPRGERGDLARRQRSDTCVSPKAHSAIGLRHRDGVTAKLVNPKKSSTQGIFGAASVSGRTESLVPPQSRPSVWIRGVDRMILFRFFVANQSAIGRVCAINTGFPAGLPGNFVSAEKCQVHAGSPGALDIGALIP